MAPSASDSQQRQLIKPSKFQPWGVQIVSVVPKSVHEILNEAVGGAVTRGWSAVAVKEGKIHAFPVKTATLSQPLNPAQHGHKLYHPSLGGSSPLLALSSKDQGAHVHVYAASPKEGAVLLWRLGHDEKTQILPRKAQARVKLAPLELDETISCLSADPLVIGTSRGRLFWCVETAQPLMLHTQLMERPKANIFSMFLSSSSSTALGPRQEPIHAVLKLSEDSILAVSNSGFLEHWKVTTVATSHKASFQATPVAHIQQYLAETGTGVCNLCVLRCNSMKHENDDSTHGLNFIVRVGFDDRGQQQPKEQIFWLQASFTNEMEFEVSQALYLSRFHASEVDCVGLVTTHEHLSYAAFQYNNNNNNESLPTLPVTVMALMDDSSVHYEVDLPTDMAPSLVKGTMGRDTVTHGWCALPTSGLGLRGRWTGLQMQAVSATPMKRKRSGSATTSDVATLTSHLRSAFWPWYQNNSSSNNGLLRLPPSLQQANPDDLEPAIVATTRQLQLEGDSSSLHNPMKWHMSFLDLLKDGGFYRSLSSEGRYALLGIGQELAAYQALSAKTQGLDHACQPHGLVNWLQSLQNKALDGGHPDGGDAAMVKFEDLLVLALRSATQYRQQQADGIYDISSSDNNSESTQPTRLWTHHPTLQAIMVKQMQVLQDTTRSVDTNRLITVVNVALASFGETQGDAVNGQERYHDMKAMGVALIQKHVAAADRRDEIAFELSVQHEYYQGICEICLDHDQDEQSTFSIEPLLAEDSPLSGGCDFKTGFEFARFVLEWYSDRGLYAHVLNYGRCCRPEVLDRFFEANARMHSYQWIPAIRNQQFDEASRHLLQDATRPGLELSSCDWKLSMAKLSNKVAQEEALNEDSKQELTRQSTTIGNKTELVRAQQMLVDDTRSGNKACLPPEDLLSLTLQKLQEATQDQNNMIVGSSDEAIQLCMVGLAICRSVNGKEQRERLASSVWAQSLLTDMASWEELIRSQQHMTKQELQMRVLDSTTFGRVLHQYKAGISDAGTKHDARTDGIAYDSSMENLVLDQMGMEAVDLFEIKRLLRIGTHLLLPIEQPMHP